MNLDETQISSLENSVAPKAWTLNLLHYNQFFSQLGHQISSNLQEKKLSTCMPEGTFAIGEKWILRKYADILIFQNFSEGVLSGAVD